MDNITIRVYPKGIILEANDSHISGKILFQKERKISNFLYDLAKISQKYSDNQALDNNEMKYVISTLANIGQKITHEIFNGGHKTIKDFLAQYSPDTPIRIVGKNDFWIPWELLYFEEDCEGCLSNFLGYNRNIYRIFSNYTCHVEISAKSKIGFLAHETVAFSKDEHELLKEYEDFDQVRWVQWKNIHDDRDIQSNWFESLHIIHFAGLILPIMYLDKSKILVNSDYWLCPSAIFEGKKNFGFEASPLVLLNLRDNYLRNPEHIITYAKLFQQYGAAGVIGSELPIPAKLALSFTEHFYRLLVEQKMTSVSEVLALTKQYLIEQCNNPFAMFYTPYFLPDVEPIESISEEPSPNTNNPQQITFNQGGKPIMILELLTTATIPAGIKFLFDQLTKITDRQIDREMQKRIAAKKIEIEQSAQNKDVAAIKIATQDIRQILNDATIDSFCNFASWVKAQIDQDINHLLEVDVLLVDALRAKREHQPNALEQKKILTLEGTLKTKIKAFKDKIDLNEDVSKDQTDLYVLVMNTLKVLEKD